MQVYLQCLFIPQEKRKVLSLFQKQDIVWRN